MKFTIIKQGTKKTVGYLNLVTKGGYKELSLRLCDHYQNNIKIAEIKRIFLLIAEKVNSGYMLQCQDNVNLSKSLLKRKEGRIYKNEIDVTKLKELIE